MRHLTFSKRLAAFLLTLSFLIVIGFLLNHKNKSSNSGLTIALQPPAAYAEGPAPNTALADIADEAGISAWYEAPTSIDLDLARNAFRTIELETSEYIIGSIDTPNLPEHFDVHGYVHIDGWLMTYYLNDEPVSKIIDTATPTINSTLLDSGLAILAGSAGVGLGVSNYYDFRYPNATNILFVAEDGDDFSITLPGDYGYFERGHALRGFDHVYEHWRLNGVDQGFTYWDGTRGYGTLSASQLPPNTEHNIDVDDWGVLIIVYRVP